MKVVFVPSPVLEGGRPHNYTPLGLVSLATVLNQAGGFEPAIYNINRRPDFHDPAAIAGEILDLAPEAIGFSCMGGGFGLSLQVAAECKKRRPRTPILFGGSQPTVSAETTVRHFPAVDAVVRGEAENIIADVLRALPDRAALARVPGVTCLDGTRLAATPAGAPIADLDRLPRPDYGFFPDYRRQENIPLEVGRGCPYACSFCGIRAFSGRRVRFYSPERLAGLMAELHPTAPANHFSLLQETFNADRQWVLAFCRALRATGLDLTWTTLCRLDHFDAGLLEQMAEVGCRGIVIGLESASPRLQKALAKPFSAERIDRLLALASRLGVVLFLSHIIGFPDETKEEMALTLRQVTQWRYRYPAQHKTPLHILTPLTGSPLYRKYEKKLKFDGACSDFADARLDPEIEGWVRRYPDMFSIYYHYPTRRLSRVEVTRARYLFVVLFAMRYTLFWLWRDEAFAYPRELLDSPVLSELPTQPVEFDWVAKSDLEAVSRFLHRTFPQLADGRHPLTDVMSYDLALLECRKTGPQLATFRHDVHHFVLAAQNSAFQDFRLPPPGRSTYFFSPQAGGVRVRRVEDAFTQSGPARQAGETHRPPPSPPRPSTPPL